MREVIENIREIESWIDDCYKRADHLDYNSLMGMSIEVGNHIRMLTLICAGTMRYDEYIDSTEGVKLDEAVIIGQLVRIYKLYDQLVFHVSEKKGEISSIFNRMLFETHATMKYLLINGESSILSFIKSSFKAPIKNYRYIKEKEKERSLTNIEKRIISKIENRIKLVNLSIEELLENKNWKIDNKNFYEILDFLFKNDTSGFNWELGYSFLFGSGSAFIHGNWYDIQVNHLEVKGDRFVPKFTYDSVDPRYILPSSFIPVNACIDLLEWRKTDPDRFIITVLKKMNELLTFLNEMDEIRIDKKSGLLD